MSNTRPFECLAFDAEFFEQAKIHVALAGFLGDEIPEVADLLLADTVDAPEALLKAVRDSTADRSSP